MGRDVMAVFKLFVFSLLLGLFFLLQTPTFLCLRWHWAPFKVRCYGNFVTWIFSKIILFVFNINVRITGATTQVDGRQTYLNVSNHLSYLDALIYFATFPSCFITSREVGETPFLGAICRFAGCLFVERRNRKHLRREMETLKLVLENGIDVTVFPEGTSSDARGVLPFKRPAFKAALMARKPVLPLALNYKKVDGVPFGLANRDKICWYGDMIFFPHFWSLLRCARIDAEICVSPPLPFNEGQDADVRTLAMLCHQRVSSSFQGLEPPIHQPDGVPL